MYIDNMATDTEPIIKDSATILKIRKASDIAVNALLYASSILRGGLRANKLDEMIAQYILDQNATPANYEIKDYGYATSISVANEIAHGLPKPLKLLKHKDVVCIDLGVKYQGVYADFAKTFVIGGLDCVDTEISNLIKICDYALRRSINALKTGGMLSDYGRMVNDLVSRNGFKTVKFLTGHGVGLQYHEAPHIYNFYHPENDVILKEGMVLAFELMITNGSDKYKRHKDGWTLYTDDDTIAVHFEYTVLITNKNALILGDGYAY